MEFHSMAPSKHISYGFGPIWNALFAEFREKFHTCSTAAPSQIPHLFGKNEIFSAKVEQKGYKEK